MRAREILIAEDSSFDFLLVEEAFRSAGLPHRLHHVRDGAQAIAYLSAEPPFVGQGSRAPPDLLILDLNMPRGGGRDVLSHMRRHAGSKVPVIVLSGAMRPQEIEEIISSGASECFIKPADLCGWIALAQTIHYRWLEELGERERCCADRPARPTSPSLTTLLFIVPR